MNVLLLHLDGALPNLALMRIWSYHQSRGDRVELRRCERKDELVPWEDWWGRARGNVRRLGTRRVSLPLFPEGT